MENVEICLKEQTEDLAFSSVGQFRQNAISCFIRRKWRKDREAGRQAQRVLPVKFDEGEERRRRDEVPVDFEAMLVLLSIESGT